VKKYKRHVYVGIHVTDVLPKWARDPDVWEAIWVDAPFTFGDNSVSLITAERFARHLEKQLDDSRRVKALVARVRALGATYIDLES
jgi:hypothetical protein